MVKSLSTIQKQVFSKAMVFNLTSLGVDFFEGRDFFESQMTLSQGSRKAIGKHRYYIMINNSHKIAVMK